MILPMIDIPVSLIGTFGAMAALGFTLNNLTLFGLVLAIGIVVDDAIVVLENTERMIARGYDARTATIKAMEEITGPIIAITLALSSVFVPCCFLGGITGQFFRQFAVTIAVSTIISAVNALTMTPSRAVLVFKTEEGIHGHEFKREALPWWIFGILGGLLTVRFGPAYLAGWFGLDGGSIGGGEEGLASELSWTATAIYFAPGLSLGLIVGRLIIRPVNAVLGWLFRNFNRLFDRMTDVYGWTVGKSLRISVIVLLIYGGLVALTYDVFRRAPLGFIPEQDQGRLILSVQLPDSASLQRTQQAMAKVEKITGRTRAWHIRSPSRGCRSCCRLTPPILDRCSSSLSRSTSGRPPACMPTTSWPACEKRMPEGSRMRRCSLRNLQRSPDSASPAVTS